MGRQLMCLLRHFLEQAVFTKSNGLKSKKVICLSFFDQLLRDLLEDMFFFVSTLEYVLRL